MFIFSFFWIVNIKRWSPSFLSLSRKVLFDNSGKSNLDLYDSLFFFIYSFFFEGRSVFFYYSHMYIKMSKKKKTHFWYLSFFFAKKISSLGQWRWIWVGPEGECEIIRFRRDCKSVITIWIWYTMFQRNFEIKVVYYVSEEQKERRTS